MLSVSMRVERNIDGVWFPAEIVSTNTATGVLTLKYIDDDNVEEMVPSCEVRIPFRDEASHNSPLIDRNKTLPKPLAGLMEDDSDERRNHIPRAVVHTNDDYDGMTAYISCALNDLIIFFVKTLK